MSRLIDADVVDELFSPFSSAFTDQEVMSAYLQTLHLIFKCHGHRCCERGAWGVDSKLHRWHKANRMLCVWCVLYYL